MEIEHQSLEEIKRSNNSNNTAMETHRTVKMRRFILLFINILFLLVGGTGGPLLIRSYFRHGGSRKWFSGFVQTAGFPFLLIPILFSFLRRRRSNSRLFLLTPSLLFHCIVIGLITGLDDYLYSYGVSFLPISTASLIISMQLGFTAIFAFFMVKQKISSYTVNAVVLLMFGSMILAVHANADLPNGESKAKYYLGFVLTLGAAIIYGMVLPLVELIYIHAKEEVTYALVLQMQFVIGLSATVVCAIGMALNQDFHYESSGELSVKNGGQRLWSNNRIVHPYIGPHQRPINRQLPIEPQYTQAISRESKHFGLGVSKYYLVVFFTSVTGQFYFLGLVGTIKYSSSLLGGIIASVCIPITQILAVFFVHEKFDGEKGVALALSLWGTTSYFYGKYKEHDKSKASPRRSQLLPVSAVTK